LNFFTRGMTIPKKKFLAVIFLFSSTFAWFYIFYYYFNEMFSPSISGESWTFQLLFLVFMVISAFIGSIISEKVNRKNFLFFWIIFGILSLIPIPFITSNELLTIFMILIGFSLGLGFPSCMAFIAESTTPDERGRVSGVVVCVAFFLAIFGLFLIPALNLEPIGILVVLILLKSTAFLSFLMDPLDRAKGEPKRWKFVLGYKSFDYYILAFIMFCIAASLVNILWGIFYSDPEYEAVTQIAQMIRYVGIGFFALIAGILADRIGRKKPIILGLLLLGIAYTIVILISTPGTYFVNLIVSGFAWGVLFTVFLVIPGDLAFSGSTERYFATGWLLAISMFVGITALGDLFSESIPFNFVSWMLTIIIFAAILPVLAATETLSESKIRQRRFKDYTEKVGKIVLESKKEK